MPNQYSLPVILPAFELLKRSARILHFIAASLILLNALRELQAHDISPIICYTQIFIAADIFLLVFLGSRVLQEAPRLNLAFRLIEFGFLLGIGFILVSDGDYGFGFTHFALSGGYFFLCYREWRVLHSEAVFIKSTGITVPSFLKDAEIGWNEVKAIIPKYHSIVIETIRSKRIQLHLRKNLKIEELQQIDEFCQKHLCN